MKALVLEVFDIIDFALGNWDGRSFIWFIKY